MPTPKGLPPYRHELLLAGDVRLHVATLPGPEPTLLLLHGIGMDWRVWQGISRRLHAHFTLRLVDLRGHGESDKPAHGYTLPHYAADVEDVLDGLNLERVILAGSSLGAMVAVAAEVPADVVSHRVLIDPPLTGGPAHDAESLAEILRLKHRPVSELVEYLRGSYPRAGTHLLLTMSEMWHEAADGVIEDVLARPNDYLAVDDALVAIESPVLILRGEQRLGSVVSDEQVDRALRLLRHGSLLRIPGAGHAIHADKPAQFVEALVNFAA